MVLSMFTQPQVQRWLELHIQQVHILQYIIHLKKVLGARGSAGTNVGSTQASLRSIQDLIKESETTTSTNDMNTYSDPIDEASNDTPPPSSPPPSSPPSSPPPSSSPSSGGGGYGGGY